MGKLRTLLATAAGGLALAGCVDASEANEKAADTAEFTKLAAVIPETQAECLKLKSATQEEIMICMRSVTERDKLRMDAEIAALDAGLEKDAETIAVQDTEAKELDTTYKGLIKQIAEKAAQEEPSR